MLIIRTHSVLNILFASCFVSVFFPMLSLHGIFRNHAIYYCSDEAETTPTNAVSNDFYGWRIGGKDDSGSTPCQIRRPPHHDATPTKSTITTTANNTDRMENDTSMALSSLSNRSSISSTSIYRSTESKYYTEDTAVDLSIVILTYKQHELLDKLLQSIQNQRQQQHPEEGRGDQKKKNLFQFRYEIIVVDNGCLPETQHVVSPYLQHDGDDESSTTVTTTVMNHTITTTSSGARLNIYPPPDTIHHPSSNGTSTFINVNHYLKICDNPGYAVGNNIGVQQHANGKWLLFLNDDIQLHQHFLYHYMKLVLPTQSNSLALPPSQQQQRQKYPLSAVGCKIVTQDGEKLIEAGSIIYKDGSCEGFGRDDTNINASKYSYPKPIDYTSGTCLMINSTIFQEYGGFDSTTFPNYYEDTDLQMHLQHDLHQYVWYEPNAVVYHAEHGSFGQKDSMKMMQKASKKFYKKWKWALNTYHDVNPRSAINRGQRRNKNMNGDDSIFVRTLRASDLRVRGASQSAPANHPTTTTANTSSTVVEMQQLRHPNGGRIPILYIDSNLPNPMQGAGFGRAYDNLRIMSQDLGYMVTATNIFPNKKTWCNEQCVEMIQSNGIEVVETGNANRLHDFMESRLGYYGVVIVSRPDTCAAVKHVLKQMYIRSKGGFSILYDSEALYYRRDQMMMELTESNVASFPGAPALADNIDLWKVVINAQRDRELLLTNMADVIVSVSEKEIDILKSHFRGDDDGGVDTNSTALSETKMMDRTVPPIYAIGHMMDVRDNVEENTTSFRDRNGILFLASFQGGMYYNGDAIWYFLRKIYKHIVAVDPTITLTIAGRKIPRGLYNYVKNHQSISHLVTFKESPQEVDGLYNNARVVIAPHLYGAGIQFKISEAMARGTPVVMSATAAGGFGIQPESNIGCVGDTTDSFQECVLRTHNNETYWNLLQRNGYDFIRQTHSRSTLAKTWEDALDSAIGARYKYREAMLNECEVQQFKCPQNMLKYLKDESRSEHLKDSCPEGESLYKEMYPDVAEWLKTHAKWTGYHHYKKNGVKEGRVYTCNATKVALWKNCTAECTASTYEDEIGTGTIQPGQKDQYHPIVTTVTMIDPKKVKKCDKGEEFYLLMYPDIKRAIQRKRFPSAYNHWKRAGYLEGREYYCS